MVQELLVYGELLQSMRLAGGKTEPPWRIWILPSELVLGAGNLCTLVTFRYSSQIQLPRLAHCVFGDKSLVLSQRTYILSLFFFSSVTFLDYELYNKS